MSLIEAALFTNLATEKSARCFLMFKSYFVTNFGKKLNELHE